MTGDRSPPREDGAGDSPIVLDRATAGYGEAIAIREITCSIREGTFNLLLGPSGAGKTTLLRTLCGLTPVKSGRIHSGHGDLSIPSMLRAHQAEVGWILQSPCLIDRLTVLDNVVLGRLPRRRFPWTLWPWTRSDREAALVALEQVGMLPLALRRTDTLSGGERQRVAIARALSSHPRLLLADEPVSNLDPQSSRIVLETIRRLCTENGLTAIVSSHQVDAVIGYADRVLALDHGRLVIEAAPDDVPAADLSRLYGDASMPARPVLAWSRKPL